MRLLHLADLHLDSPMRGLMAYEGAPDTAASCTRDAFRAATSFAVDRGVDLVVISGDIYDGDWRDFSTGVFFVGQLGRLREAGIPVVMISGNHDAASQITRSLTLPEGSRRLTSDRPETVAFEHLGVAVHGRSFATRSVSENLASAYPPALPGMTNIGLLHTSMAGHPDHDPYAPCSPSDLQRLEYDYWALGHVHARGRACQEVNAHYSGCLQGRSVRECGPRGGLLVELEPGTDPLLEPVDFDVMRWQVARIDCADLSSPDDLLARARGVMGELVEDAAGLPVACRVRLEGVTSLHNWLLAEGERLRAELVALAGDVARDGLWLGGVSVATSPRRVGAPARDPDLASALEGVLGDERTRDELAMAIDELVARVPADLTDSHGPLSWLADRDAALDRVLEIGAARLLRELDLEPGGGGL